MNSMTVAELMAGGSTHVLGTGPLPEPFHEIAEFAVLASPIQSAGKKKCKNTTGYGNPYLARILGNAAAVAGKTDTFLGERYRRIARRRGGKKPNVAIDPMRSIQSFDQHQ